MHVLGFCGSLISLDSYEGKNIVAGLTGDRIIILYKKQWKKRKDLYDASKTKNEIKTKIKSLSLI